MANAVFSSRVRLLASFAAGLGLGYFRKGIIRVAVLALSAALLLSALSLIPYKREGIGAQHLLPVSFPLHAKIDMVVYLLPRIVPPLPYPPNIRLTINFFASPILVFWYNSICDAYLASFVIFFATDLAALVAGTLLGDSVRRKSLPGKTSHHNPKASASQASSGS
jgi:hypothetical protein